MTGVVTLHHGDNRDVLKGIPDNSIDAVACDPPYGLSDKTPDSAVVAEVLRAWLDGREIEVEGAGFMGRAWDAFVPGPAVWRECFRVLKPGGHLVAFFGTRTYDLGALAIRLAGFEVRDLIAWLYGNGFPKSPDIGKAIAKARVEDVEAVRVVCRFVRAAMDRRRLKSRDLAPAFGCNPRLIDHWAARDTDSQPSLPTPDQWLQLKAALGLSDELDDEVARLNARKGSTGDAWTSADVVGEHDGTPGGFGDHRFSVRDASIRQLAGEAARWEGWTTALKPALEPVCFARKPLIGTVAANVQRFGTGGLNVEACRIGDETLPAMVRHTTQMGTFRGAEGGVTPERVGRYPANVVHDGSEEAIAAFPADADRFFYSAKADDLDRLGSGHPTVKPLDLMGWLVRLVTPPGGTVLDPFAGSGTTGIAAMREGFNAVLIEREADFVADIRLRLDHAAGVAPHSAALKVRNKRPKPVAAGDLFGGPE